MLKGILIPFVIAAIIGTLGLLSLTNESKTIDRYRLKGKIINEISIPPYCGVFAFSSIFEVEISSYNDEEYNAKTIPVIVRCPRSYGEEYFENDIQYHFLVSKQDSASYIFDYESEVAYQAFKLPFVIIAERISKRR